MQLTDKFFVNERYSLIELLDSSLEHQTIRNLFNHPQVTNSSLCRVVFKSECSINELRELASQSQNVMTSKHIKKSNYATELSFLNHNFTAYTSKATYQVLIQINAHTTKKVDISIAVNNNEDDNQFDLSSEEFEQINEYLFRVDDSSDDESDDLYRDSHFW